MAKILALLVILLALGGGGAAGFLLQPPPPEPEDVQEEPEPEPIEPSTVYSMEKSFAVPVLRGGRAWTHVVLLLGIESHQLTTEDIHSREPILRDSLNEALFLHGSLGDFDGDFTEPLAMNRLRTRLNQAAARALEDPTSRVLVISVVRQQS